MKKKYIIPDLMTVKVNFQHHLMDLSNGGTSSISNQSADTDAFVKGGSSPSSYNVWDDDWSK